jgi:hypothetical protein
LSHAPEHFQAPAERVGQCLGPHSVVNACAFNDCAEQLHRDMGDIFGGLGDGKTWLDVPPPVVQVGQLYLPFGSQRGFYCGSLSFATCQQVNFPLEVKAGSTVAHTRSNGVTRCIAGTHHSHEPIPSEEAEPKWMKLMVTGPAPAGCAMLRDLRTWVSRLHFSPAS